MFRLFTFSFLVLFLSSCYQKPTIKRNSSEYDTAHILPSLQQHQLKGPVSSYISRSFTAFPSGVKNQTTVMRHEFDTLGFLIKSYVILEDEGREYIHCEYTYRFDTLGRVAHYISKSGYTGEGDDIVKVTIHYSNDDLILSTNWRSIDFPFHKSTYTYRYDSLGFLQEEFHSSPWQGSQFRTEYKRDTSGVIVSKLMNELERDHIKSIDYTYSEDNNGTTTRTSVVQSINHTDTTYSQADFSLWENFDIDSQGNFLQSSVKQENESRYYYLSTREIFYY